MNPNEQYYHFKLPGSTHGFSVYPESGAINETICLNSGEGSLRAGLIRLNPTQSFRIGKRTYLHPSDFHDDRYEPVCSPILYPGQTICARVKAEERCQPELYAAMYVRIRGGEYLEGERKLLSKEEWTALTFDIPTLPHMLIEEMGVRLVAGPTCGGGAAVVCMDEVHFTGEPCYDIDFHHETLRWKSKISQFTYLKGSWSLENGRLMGSTCDYGETYTGNIRWGDYTLEGSITLACAGEAALNLRVQGAIRSYSVALKDGKLMIRKNKNGYVTLAECDHPTVIGETYRFRISAKGNEIAVCEKGELILSVVDEDKPYLTGCIGCSVFGGARAYFDDLKIN